MSSRHRNEQAEPAVVKRGNQPCLHFRIAFEQRLGRSSAIISSSSMLPAFV